VRRSAKATGRGAERCPAGAVLETRPTSIHTQGKEIFWVSYTDISSNGVDKRVSIGSKIPTIASET